MASIMRKMGCLQLKRWLSFLPAAFVVYILLHYFVYQPDIQETHTAFTGSSSRIVKLSANDIGIKEPFHLASVEAPDEVTYSYEVGLTFHENRPILLPSVSKEGIEQIKPSEMIDKGELEKNRISSTNMQPSKLKPFSDDQFIPETTLYDSKVTADDNSSRIRENPVGDGSPMIGDPYALDNGPRIGDDQSADSKPNVGEPLVLNSNLIDELNSISSDNDDTALFVNSEVMNELRKKSQQQKRANELKAMQVKRRKEVISYLQEGTGSIKQSPEGLYGRSSSEEKFHYENVDATGNVLAQDTRFRNEPSFIDASSDQRDMPFKSNQDRKTNKDITANYIATYFDPVNSDDSNSGGQLGTGSSSSLMPSVKDEGMSGGKISIANGDGAPSEQDSIIVPRELLSREDKDSKSKSEDLSVFVEEKEKLKNGVEMAKSVPEGDGVVVSTNNSNSEISTGSLSPSGKPQQPLQNLEGSVESTKPAIDGNSKNSSDQPQLDPSKQIISQTIPKDNSQPKPTATSSQAHSKESTVKANPKAQPVTKPREKTELKKKQAAPVGHAISALKGPITVGQRYEKGFATAHEDLCPNNGRDLKVLILITTAPDHEKHRNAVRQTWGHFAMRRDIAMAFMVGRTARTDVQNVIDKENDRYGDIIEANFVDHYSNLTLKTVSMFEWAKTYCSEARFVLKTDDDMYINVPLLLAFIVAKKDEKRAMFGRLAKGWKPVRNTKSKYYIDVATYSRVRYPDFLTGPAYLFTNDVVEEMYQKSLNTTFFVLEDVLITGIVGESLGVKRVGDSHFRNEKIKLADTCKLMQSISIHMVKYEEQFDIYKRTLDGKTKCKTR